METGRRRRQEPRRLLLPEGQHVGLHPGRRGLSRPAREVPEGRHRDRRRLARQRRVAREVQGEVRASRSSCSPTTDKSVCAAVRRLEGEEHVRPEVHGRRAQHLPDRRQGRAAPRMAQGQGARSRRGSARGRRRSSDRQRWPPAAHLPATHSTRSRALASRRKTIAPRRIFVLDTNVHDARPLGHLPVRGARHLHPDDRARRARRRQERHVGSRAQRAPGEPLPRRADGDADKAQIDRGHRAARGQVHARRQEAAERPAVLPDAAADGRPARHAARSRRRQRHPRADAGAAEASSPTRASRWCRRTSTCASRPRSSACMPRTTTATRRSRTPTCSTPASRSCRRTSGIAPDASSSPGTSRRPQLLSRARQAGRATGRRTSSSTRTASTASKRIGAPHRRRLGGARSRARLSQRAPRRLGHQRAQPRAELRAQPAARSGDRFRHDPRPRRHRQDAADARRRPVAGARDQSLQRDHHDARDDPARRGHRLPARHGRGKDGALDGRADGQPRGADAEPGRRQLGPRRDQRPAAQPHQDPLAQFHARPHVPESLPDPRRGAEPDAEADEGAR